MWTGFMCLGIGELVSCGSEEVKWFYVAENRFRWQPVDNEILPLVSIKGSGQLNGPYLFPRRGPYVTKLLYRVLSLFLWLFKDVLSVRLWRQMIVFFKLLFNDAAICWCDLASVIDEWVWNVDGVILVVENNRNMRTDTCCSATLSISDPRLTDFGWDTLQIDRFWMGPH